MLTGIVSLAAVAALVHIAYVDFWHLKIRNRASLGLLGLYALWSLSTGFQTLSGDIVAALALSTIALAMWLAGIMGAGDVKLYAVLGLFVGYAHLAVYAALLLLASVVIVLVLAAAKKWPANTGARGRLREIALGGRSPYGVPMCAAGIPTLLMRAFF